MPQFHVYERKSNEYALWEPMPTGEFDEDGEEFFDYVLAGSEPLSPFEAMLFAAANVQCDPDLTPYLGA